MPLIALLAHAAEQPARFAAQPLFAVEDAYPHVSAEGRPGGRRIAFSSNRSDFFQIYVMNADGSEQVQVAQGSVTDVRPQRLPDGSGLVFNREQSGRIDLWQVNPPETR